MAEVLVVAEHSGGAVKKVTLEMLTLARELGEPAAVVLGAPGAAAGLDSPAKHREEDRSCQPIRTRTRAAHIPLPTAASGWCCSRPTRAG